MAADPQVLPASVSVAAEPSLVVDAPAPAVIESPQPSPFAALEQALGQVRRRDLGYAAAKRTLDVVVAATLLLVLLPIFAVIALAIWIDSGGPVFYCAKRIGRFGDEFCVVKFRSMRAGSDTAAHAEFVRTLMRDDGTSCALYKVPGDSRVTRVGALLRRTSLDELPQLWNVLRGEMSLVGPRPDVPYAFDDYKDWMHRRLMVKPGITGLWQVSGRSRVSLLDMYKLDVRYVAEASLLTDLRILWRTVPVVLGRDGAA
jgi:lipopolysaccharide/colanic/teichoic acid biosynthesis glycosyltransferase